MCLVYHLSSGYFAAGLLTTMADVAEVESAASSPDVDDALVQVQGKVAKRSSFGRFIVKFGKFSILFSI